MRKIIVFTAIIVCFALIVGLFWWQELQYLKPTPVPAHFLGGKYSYSPQSPSCISQDSMPICLYFFNPDCPCSRFNQQNFKRLYRNYHHKAKFYAVIENEFEDRERYFNGMQVTFLLDSSRQIANELGVYATPQIVILDRHKQVYYKGNFNRSRYCTDKRTDFAGLALESLLEAHPLPDFGKLASTPYGCSIFENENFWGFFLRKVKKD